MRLPGFFTLASLALALPGQAAPGTATLTLVDEGDFNKIRIGVDPGFAADSDTTTLDGTLTVLLEIDASTDQASELTVQEGDVDASNVSLSGSTLFLGSYSVDSMDLGATIGTPDPPGMVDPPTGNFPAEEHTFTVDRGTLAGSATVLGTTTPINLDFAAAPIGGAGMGTGNVKLTLKSEDATSKSYDVELTYPIDVEDSFEAAPGLDVAVTATGNVKAVGMVTIDKLNAYEQWAAENGFAGEAFDDDSNGDGVANGLQWALGLTADESPWPHLLQPASGAGSPLEFTITLPGGGSAGPLTVQASSDPGTTPFAPLPAGAVSAGNPIPAGTTGTVTISLPAGERGFVQLLAVEP